MVGVQTRKTEGDHDSSERRMVNEKCDVALTEVRRQEDFAEEMMPVFDP